MATMTSKGSVDVAVSGGALYIKVAGLATMNNGRALHDFATEMIGAGFKDVVVDLLECTGMDSTFMGTLAGVTFHVPESSRPNVMVINASPHSRKLLESIGLTAFVQVKDEPAPMPKVEMQHLRDGFTSDTEKLLFMKQAHETLIEMDKRNQARFGGFLQALTEELERAKLGTL
ncbi:MAG: STAS domain-containing protein [Planctomycetes bacterium]|nr:STAS domain-containing protein [Planctomycetota bacterium]